MDENAIVWRRFLRPAAAHQPVPRVRIYVTLIGQILRRTGNKVRVERDQTG